MKQLVFKNLQRSVVKLVLTLEQSNSLDPCFITHQLKKTTTSEYGTKDRAQITVIVIVQQLQ